MGRAGGMAVCSFPEIKKEEKDRKNKGGHKKGTKSVTVG